MDISLPVVILAVPMSLKVHLNLKPLCMVSFHNLAYLRSLDRVISREYLGRLLTFTRSYRGFCASSEKGKF